MALAAASVYPIAAELPILSNTWKPIIFSRIVLKNFFKQTILFDIANQNWKGEIEEFGDSVEIRQDPIIAIKDWVDGQEIVREHLQPSSQTLLIDKGKYWAFTIGSVQAKQVDLPMATRWSEKASKDLKIAIDKVVVQDIPSDVAPENTGATAGLESKDIDLGASGAPLVVTDSNIIDVLISFGTVLDEQQTDDDNRYAAVPPWMYDRIKTSDFEDASLTGDGTSIARTGKVKLVNNMRILKSSQLLTTADGSGSKAWSVLFGHPDALTFATQMVESRTMPAPNTFGTTYESLQVFGYKVVLPIAIGRAYVAKS